jgi:hypothetical protein
VRKNHQFAFPHRILSSLITAIVLSTSEPVIRADWQSSIDASFLPRLAGEITDMQLASNDQLLVLGFLRVPDQGWGAVLLNADGSLERTYAPNCKLRQDTVGTIIRSCVRQPDG